MYCTQTLLLILCQGVLPTVYSLSIQTVLYVKRIYPELSHFRKKIMWISQRSTGIPQMACRGITMIRCRRKRVLFPYMYKLRPPSCHAYSGSRSFRYKSKQIRYTCKVDSIQTHVTSNRFDTEYHTRAKTNLRC